MITREEILGNNKCPPELEENLKKLLEAVNKLRSLWGKPMKVTSGFRSMAHHIQVYKDKGITDLAKIPMKSKHLSCEAIDIYDPKFELTNFCKQNEAKMKEFGLYFEDDMSVPRLHIQCVAPKSGNRWFKP